MSKEECLCGKRVKTMKDGRLVAHASPHKERDEHGDYFPRCPHSHTKEKAPV